MNNLRVRLGLLFTLGLAAVGVRADEGMWLLNAPLPQLEANHGFKPDAAWLEHVQKASVRFTNGGSGSFVSPDGLIITNHHVAQDAIYKLSSKDHNYLRDGFKANTQAEELRCVDLELNVLMTIEDVTEKVNAAVKPGMTEAELLAARRNAKAAIEKEASEKTGYRADVMTLYQGARYHLYCYKKYTDVRLVFAPEEQAAFFGGDPDNFEYPRYNLDCTFFRAYENGQPAKVQHYFKWSAKGTSEGELVFVSGHPGSTSRLLTVEELAYTRDVRIPLAVALAKHTEVLKSNYAARSPESARIAQDELRRVSNGRKVYDGRVEALLDPAIWSAKRKAQADLLAFAAGKPEFADVAPAIEKIAKLQKDSESTAKEAMILESSFDSAYVRLARDLYRHAYEKVKPNGDRLREYRDSAAPTLEQALFSAKPIYDDFERVKLAGYFGFAANLIGAENPYLVAALAGKAPSVRAAELIGGTRLKDIEFRKQLYAMTPAEMDTVTDPFILFVKSIDARARELRRIGEERREVVESNQAILAKARFAMLGTSVYPDATFTLRLSYGKVLGYNEGGKVIPPFTKIGGKFERSELMEGKAPFNMPESWTAARGKLKLDTPYNFVSTCDIIGGNSGSPTLNKDAEFVGIIFDGNIYSLVGDFAYSDTLPRAVSVDARGIIEALRSIYGADALVKELLP